MSGPARENPAPRFLRESAPTESEDTVSAGELLERLEQQAGELGVLKERLGSATAALASERERRGRLEHELSEAREAQEKLDKAVAGFRRERTLRKGVEQELVQAREEIEALRLEVEHAWTRLQHVQEPTAKQSRWRRRSDQGTD
jgi:predicted RNase H-like nuclease (RuvC/YqgF family)